MWVRHGKLCADVMKRGGAKDIGKVLHYTIPEVFEGFWDEILHGYEPDSALAWGRKNIFTYVSWASGRKKELEAEEAKDVELLYKEVLWYSLGFESEKDTVTSRL